MARNLATTPYGSPTYDNALKEFYDGAMQSLVAKQFPLIDWLTKEGRVRKVKPQGKYIVFATELNMGSGFGARGEGDYIPDADQIDTVQGQVPYMRGFKGRIRVSAETMKFGKEGAGSFADVVKQEVNGAITTMRQHAAPALWGQGDGILASSPSNPNSTTVPVTSSEVYNAILPGSRWLEDGMKILPIQSTAAYAADGTMTAATTVSSVDTDTQITTASKVNHDAAVRYFVEHHTTNTGVTPERGSVTVGTANSYRGPQGMSALCDDGTNLAAYCGITVATYAQWKALISHNSGTARAVTLDLIYKLWSKISRKVGSFDLKLMAWTNFDVLREITDLLEHYVEFKPRKFEPGWDKYDIMVYGSTIPIKIDHKCPSFIYFLRPEDITVAQGCPPEIAKEHGGMWRFVPDYDSYEAVWRWILNTYTRNRNHHGCLKDLTVTIASI